MKNKNQQTLIFLQHLNKLINKSFFNFLNLFEHTNKCLYLYIFLYIFLTNFQHGQIEVNRAQRNFRKKK